MCVFENARVALDIQSPKLASTVEVMANSRRASKHFHKLTCILHSYYNLVMQYIHAHAHVRTHSTVHTAIDI